MQNTSLSSAFNSFNSEGRVRMATTGVTTILYSEIAGSNTATVKTSGEFSGKPTSS